MAEKRTNLLERDTLVREYLQWLKSKTAYVGGIERLSQSHRPFLSIVMRTQGKRRAALQEIFLCLGGQTDMDFEVRLILHKSEEKNRDAVRCLIDKQPEELRARICVHEVDYGTRATPLNVGFSEAKGDYIAVLDDDDLIFENWVEVFHCAAKQNFGRILHAYSFVQDWTKIPEGRQEGALRSVYKPIPEYCAPFDLFAQVYANRCPFMSMAFPAFIFQETGEVFDESLDTTEDWDYIMRTSALCGVRDVEEPTSIYRIWKNEENSESLHGKAVWKKNQEYIWKKIEKQPLLVEKKYIAGLIEISELRRLRQNREKGIEDTRVGEWFQPKLYLDFGEGYHERNVLRTGNSGEGNLFRYRYVIKELSAGKVRSFRWDPSEKKNFVIRDLRITLKERDGTACEIRADKGLTNGISLEASTVVFLREDPQICFKTRSVPDLSEVEFCGKVETGITDEILDKVLKRNMVSEFVKRLRWRFF